MIEFLTAGRRAPGEASRVAGAGVVEPREQGVSVCTLT
jgi:hypothetical protein